MLTINGIKCPKCKDIIVSRAIHDQHSCSCSYCFIDGGREYLRQGYNGKEAPSVVTIEIPNLDSPQELERDYTTRTNLFGVIPKETYSSWNVEEVSTNSSKPKTPSLEEVLAGAERAQKRIQQREEHQFKWGLGNDTFGPYLEVFVTSNYSPEKISKAFYELEEESELSNEEDFFSFSDEVGLERDAELPVDRLIKLGCPKKLIFFREKKVPSLLNLEHFLTLFSWYVGKKLPDLYIRERSLPCLKIYNIGGGAIFIR